MFPDIDKRTLSDVDDTWLASARPYQIKETWLAHQQMIGL